MPSRNQTCEPPATISSYFGLSRREKAASGTARGARENIVLGGERTGTGTAAWPVPQRPISAESAVCTGSPAPMGAVATMRGSRVWSP
ncbi:MAG: hypothetical protein R3D89_01245 [Sphingomonadaceae bacterium]